MLGKLWEKMCTITCIMADAILSRPVGQKVASPNLFQHAGKPFLGKLRLNSSAILSIV